jgi:hypothetical protein
MLLLVRLIDGYRNLNGLLERAGKGISNLPSGSAQQSHCITRQQHPVGLLIINFLDRWIRHLRDYIPGQRFTTVRKVQHRLVFTLSNCSWPK